jgi:hypothetical protein
VLIPAETIWFSAGGGHLDRQSLMLLHSKRIVVRRPVAFVGRRKVIRPLGKVAKVEGHAQIGVHALTLVVPDPPAFAALLFRSLVTETAYVLPGLN